MSTAARTLLARAVGQYSARRLSDAESLCRQVLLHEPGCVDALHLLGAILGQSGRAGEAVPCLEEALRRGGENPGALHNLGEAQRLAGQIDDAANSFQKAVALSPSMAEAHFGLGNVRKAQGRDEEAVECFRAAIAARSNFAKAHFNLANTWRDQGRLAAAVTAYGEALAQLPQWFEALLNLGNVLAEMGQLDDAIETYRKALDLRPDDPDLRDNLGDAYYRQGRRAEAVSAYLSGRGALPDGWLRRWRTEFLPEVIPHGRASIDPYREGVMRKIEGYRRDVKSVELDRLHGSGAEPPMALTYQGRDDRPLKSAMAEFFAERIQPFQPLPGEGMPHVGVVVTHGHEGVFGRCFAPLVDRLDRKQFRVTVFCSLAGRNVLSRYFLKNTRDFVVLPSRVDVAAERIRETRCDLLLYWEVGTDSMNYFLPFFCPAPHQCATWGWPTTTGNPRVDSFLSSGLIEPENGQSHYTETLIQPPRLPMYYERIEVIRAPGGRESFGFDRSSRLYVCAQNLRKFHPDFDPVLADITRLDPTGVIAIIRDEQPRITELLLARWRREIPDALPRIRVLGRMERGAYLSLLAAADVCLDTMHYGAGANTVCDAFAAGTPMITLPGEFHRGRFAAGVLRHFGLPETVVSSPADYACRAVEVAKDDALREQLSRRMAEACSILFESTDAVRAVEQFLLETIAELRSY